ncbi:carbohydrate ABC transporter permease [Stackebrandtia nassauensis]|uniref:Binding-protein-dependent transport systems inner membrane component n=1 Tax=Stackebrandtia nassauensis (strain DSM 44728 / CIP 108903 / NRRL B-16338 / NBRC 102104 / LLR-40K-21) TaxID=446470 RepID=D3Q0A8_STANL|nr:carbohydrate ABC transporter permease [Stackebrandtia nassauensis]ADD39772.1 binding-protein-dependent transport systems inner membrane component [Stackebrandtia nassauensis DSM 44728]
MTARAKIITTAVLTVVAVYFLLPVYWLIVAATKTTEDLFGSNGLWFSSPRLWTNMVELFTFQDGIYLRWTLNSILYAGVGALCATFICAMAGYGLAKYRFAGREKVFNLVLGGVLLPATALTLPLYLLMSEFSMANTYWAVLLPAMVSPFGVYLCRIYAAAAVPDELLEAARIDGASEFRVFLTVALRIMTPALVTIFLFQFVGIWNNYFLPLIMLSDSNLYPITLGLTSWQGFASRQPILYQLTVGGAFVSVIPLMIMMVVLQRFWRTGLTQGSVKE